MKIENDLVEVVVDKSNSFSSVPEIVSTHNFVPTREREVDYRCEEITRFKPGMNLDFLI